MFAAAARDFGVLQWPGLPGTPTVHALEGTGNAAAPHPPHRTHSSLRPTSLPAVGSRPQSAAGDSFSQPSTSGLAQSPALLGPLKGQMSSVAGRLTDDAKISLNGDAKVSEPRTEEFVAEAGVNGSSKVAAVARLSLAEIERAQQSQQQS